MTQRLPYIVLSVALMTVIAGPRVAAQETPAVEVAGGYQVHLVGGLPEWGSFDRGPRRFSGWFASAAWNATSNWGLVFEVANAQDHTEFIRRDVTRDLVDGRLRVIRTEDRRVRREYTMRAGGAGIRYRKATGGVRPFAQLLVGRMSYENVDSPPPPPQRYRLHCTPGGCVPMPVSDVPTGRDGPHRLLMMWPGGGVDVQLLGRAVVRLQADSVGIVSGGLSFPRFLVSAVYQIGPR